MKAKSFLDMVYINDTVIYLYTVYYKLKQRFHYIRDHIHPSIYNTYFLKWHKKIWCAMLKIKIVNTTVSASASH